MSKTYPKKLFDYVRNNPSRILIWVILLSIASINVRYENWNERYNIIAWDVNSYYAFLPMVFIHKDIDLDFVKDGNERIREHYWPIKTETGKSAIITSMGMSFLYAPFFLVCHGIVELIDFPGDEFSYPYKIALIISSFFYLCFGLIFLRKVLLKYYSRLVTGITLVIIAFGTNLLHYTTEEPTMTHAYSFSLIAVFLYLLIKWLEKPGIRMALLTGALAGLITLIRPTNVIILLLLVFWGVGSFGELGQRIMLYLRKAHLILIMAGAFILVWVPQFIYWHYISGSIFFNTYGSLGVGFMFDQPQFFHTLFSYRKGWLLYTPVMVLAIIGLIMLYRQHRRLFFPVLIYFIINVWVVSSWWCWWYGGGFSQRSFIDFYGIMAIPMAAFLTWTMNRRLLLKIPLLIIFAGLLYLNIFQTIQYRKGIIHNKMMTKQTYWLVFHDMSTPGGTYWDNLVFPDYNAAKYGIYYPETEIPHSLEKEFGMRGWQYLEKIKDSLLLHEGRYDSILMARPGTSIDSIAGEEALQIFRQIVKRHYEERP
jgi:hypothetical protein